MEKYIISEKNPALGAAINRLANIARWYLDSHPEARDTRAIITNDIMQIALHIDD